MHCPSSCGEIDGPRVCYSLNPAPLEPLKSFLQAVADPEGQSTKTDQGCSMSTFERDLTAASLCTAMVFV